MTDVSSGDFGVAMSEMDDEQLLEVLREHGSYVAEAVAAAREEATKRGLVLAPPKEPDAPEPVAACAVAEELPFHSVKWAVVFRVLVAVWGAVTLFLVVRRMGEMGIPADFVNVGRPTMYTAVPSGVFSIILAAYLALPRVRKLAAWSAALYDFTFSSLYLGYALPVLSKASDSGSPALFVIFSYGWGAVYGIPAILEGIYLLRALRQSVWVFLGLAAVAVAFVLIGWQFTIAFQGQYFMQWNVFP
jgi:hypothetical protein